MVFSNDSNDDFGGTVNYFEPSNINSYYSILQVSEDASRVMIREAYTRLKNTYSTTNQALYSIIGADEAKNNLARVEEAFRVLDDERQRLEFDLRMGASKGEGEKINFNVNLHPTKIESGVLPSADELSQTIAAALPKKHLFLRSFGGLDMASETRDRVDEIWNTGEMGEGGLLKQAREAIGVDLREVQKRIKVLAEHLLTIENNDYPKLPAFVYVKGFLKSYLNFLGIRDTEPFIKAYTERFDGWKKKKI